LEINRDASAADVAKAYNKLSLKWHPKLSKEDYNTTYHHFCLISEAYEVLSDRKSLLYLSNQAYLLR
jgi:DnaJ family protein B protein 13